MWRCWMETPLGKCIGLGERLLLHIIPKLAGMSNRLSIR